MVDQPEGRPKSPKPGKVKPVTKKHSVSKPYERPSSSRGVLARVKELITPVTPGWLKDLVLKPPETTSVTDALEQTVAEVQAVEEKDNEQLKKTLKTLSLPITGKKPAVPEILPFTSERMTAAPVQENQKKDAAPTSPNLDISGLNSSVLHNSSNILEDTLGEIKWSSIRPAVKQKYSFSVAAFNTPSKSPNLSSIPIQTRNLNRSNTSFTNRSRVSFGGTSLQRTLLHNRSQSNNTIVTDEKKPIKVKPISRTTIRPGVTSNTAKKILEQLESLSRPLGHLPSSRPSTPSSRQGSRASTPLSMSRSSTPQHLLPYNKTSERSIPIRSLTSTPQERHDLNSSSSFGGKMKREKTNHYSRIKEEDEEELAVPEFESAPVPVMDFKPIEIESQPDHKPIKIVNQTQPKSTDTPMPLKDALRNSLSAKVSPLLKKSSPNSTVSGGKSDTDDTSDSSFTFSAPITVTNSALSFTSGCDVSEFSFGTPSELRESDRKKRMSVEEALKSAREAEQKREGDGEEADGVEIAAKEPPGSWSCVPCRLSNPSTMTRCSGCEAPNPTSLAPGLSLLQSPIGIKRAPITPMKPASSPKQLKSSNPPKCGKIVEDAEGEDEAETRNPLVKFALQQQSGWNCGSCMLRNKEESEKCVACQTAKPSSSPSAKPSISNKLAGMDNPLLKFKTPTNSWNCESCMLSNPSDLDQCKACQAVKSKPVAANPLDKFKSSPLWECGACMLKNEESASKCKACETAKTAGKTSDNKVLSINPLAKFSTSPKWECGSCMLKNDENLAKCVACDTAKPDTKKSSGFNPLDKFKSGGSQWECSVCMMKNKEGDAKCAACETPNKNAATAPTTSSGVLKQSLGSFSQSGWSCATCMLVNAEDASQCKACQTTKPGSEKAKVEQTFKFGTTTSSGSSGDEKPAFSFGVPAGGLGDSKVFSFGTTPSTDTDKKTDDGKPVFSFGAKSEPEGSKTSASITFGTPSSTTTQPLAFGLNTATTTESKTTESKPPAFTFGTPSSSTTATTTSDTKPAFAAALTSDTAPKFNFGGSAPTVESKPAAAVAAPTFNFGGGITNSSTEPDKKAAPTFNFGGSTTATSSDAAKPPSTGFNFGGSAPKTAAPAFNFGGSSSTPTFNFGGTKPAEETAKPTNTGFQFGAPAADSGDTMDASSQSPKQSTSLFGQKPATNGPTFNFGGGGDNKTPSKGFSFGSSTNSTTPAFGSTPAPTFGSTSTSSFGSSTAASFGASNTPTPAPFSFGQSSAAPTSFGTSQPAPSSGFNFGEPAKPAAGAFNFSSSTPQPSTGTFSFGGATTTSTPAAPAFNFGSNSNTTENKPFAFGNSATNPTPAFGSSNPAAVATPSFGNSTPSFGNSNTPAPASALPAPAFNFGAGSTTPTSSAFQFGSPQTTPAQNNMFNPVSTNNSGRKIRKAVRRTKR